MLAVAVLPVLPDVGDVQERGALEPDLDEGALHARQHARDTAETDVADEPARARALDVQFLDDALLEHRDTGFLRRYVDQDLVRHPRLDRRDSQHRRSSVAVIARGNRCAREASPFRTAASRRCPNSFLRCGR